MYEGVALGANASQQMQQSNAIKPTPELGRLKAAAERVRIATLKVDNFLDSFHGPRPEGLTGTSLDAHDCYRNDIESVFSAIDQLESAVSSLQHIG